MKPLIYSNKIPNPGYNGNTYVANRTGGTAASVVSTLAFVGASGEVIWTRSTNVGGAIFTGSATPQIWSFTTTPSSSYEAFVTVTESAFGNIAYVTTPLNTWITIGSVATNIIRISHPSNALGFNGITFSITLRKVGDITPTIVTSITLDTEQVDLN